MSKRAIKKKVKQQKRKAQFTTAKGFVAQTVKADAERNARHIFQVQARQANDANARSLGEVASYEGGLTVEIGSYEFMRVDVTLRQVGPAQAYDQLFHEVYTVVQEYLSRQEASILHVPREEQPYTSLTGKDIVLGVRAGMTLRSAKRCSSRGVVGREGTLLVGETIAQAFERFGKCVEEKLCEVHGLKERS